MIVNIRTFFSRWRNHGLMTLTEYFKLILNQAEFNYLEVDFFFLSLFYVIKVELLC